MRRSALAIATVLALGGCGGGGTSTPSSPPGTTGSATSASSRGTAAPSATATGPSGSTSPASPSTSAPNATVAMLKSATIPASAAHPTMTLASGTGRAGDVTCSLDPFTLVLADLDSDNADEVVGTLSCTRGKKPQPAEVLVVRRDGSVGGLVSLARKGRREAAVVGLSAVKAGPVVSWTTSDGSGTPSTIHHGTVRLVGGGAVVIDVPDGAGPPTDPTAPSSTATSASPSASASTPPTASPSPSTAATPTHFPRVRRSTDLAAGGSAGFWSQSGRIGCAIHGGSVRCDVAQVTFQRPPQPPGCLGEWGGSFTLTAGGTAGAMTCAGDPAYLGEATQPAWFDKDLDSRRQQYGVQGTVLGYGHELRGAGISCVIDETAGATCRTFDGAHGFTVSRERYQTW